MRYLPLLMFLVACAPEDDELALGESEQALEIAGLTGTRTTIASVIGAENQLFTRDDRLLVSGDKGVYELIKKADGTFERVTLVGEQRNPQCSFGGLAQGRDGTLYANCYGLTDSYLFAADASATNFHAIYKLSGRGLANGLTADERGRLYLTNTFSNQLLRLTPASDPQTIASQEVFQNRAGTLSNGLDYYGGSVYWTDSVSIKRNSVDAPTTNPRVVVTDFAYFDDLHVDDAGILATDFTGGVVRAYDARGRSTGVSRSVFSGPSSVSRAGERAGLGANTLVVTERGANRVSIYE